MKNLIEIIIKIIIDLGSVNLDSMCRERTRLNSYRDPDTIPSCVRIGILSAFLRIIFGLILFLKTLWALLEHSLFIILYSIET